MHEGSQRSGIAQVWSLGFPNRSALLPSYTTLSTYRFQGLPQMDSHDLDLLTTAELKSLLGRAHKITARTALAIERQQQHIAILRARVDRAEERLGDPDQECREVSPDHPHIIALLEEIADAEETLRMYWREKREDREWEDELEEALRVSEGRDREKAKAAAVWGLTAKGYFDVLG